MRLLLYYSAYFLPIVQLLRRDNVCLVVSILRGKAILQVLSKKDDALTIFPLILFILLTGPKNGPKRSKTVKIAKNDHFSAKIFFENRFFGRYMQSGQIIAAGAQKYPKGTPKNFLGP